MNTRRTLRRSTALAMLLIATAGEAVRQKAEPVELNTRQRRYDDEDQPAEADFMFANNRHARNRGKRGGHGKGRKWWNNT